MRLLFLSGKLNTIVAPRKMVAKTRTTAKANSVFVCGRYVNDLRYNNSTAVIPNKPISVFPRSMFG